MRTFKARHLIVSFMAGSVFFSGIGYAASNAKIEALLSPVKYFFDGVEKKAPDKQQGINYNGTTYVPLRFVAESLGQQVRYDSKQGSIYISPKQKGKPFADGSSAVAKVNGIGISEHSLYETLLKGGNGISALDRLIVDELLKQEADKNGIVISSADLDKELALLKENFGSEEEFNQALVQYGMTLEDLQPDLLQQARLRKLLQPKVKITDQDIQTYYDQNKASFETPEQVRASHILVTTKEEAEQIASKLKNGGDFAAIAKAQSLDTGSKEQGGDLGYFERGAMVAEFEDAAFSLKAGEVSGPVQTTFGYHIIKVTDHKAAVKPTLEEAKPRIVQEMTSQQIYTLSQALVQELREKAKIENSLTDSGKTAGK